MAYFTIYHGLRGCYMPDSSYVIKADTRRELKNALQYEADLIRQSPVYGLSKAAIAALAASAWRNRKRASDLVAPFGMRRGKPGSEVLGVFTGISRAQYLAELES